MVNTGQVTVSFISNNTVHILNASSQARFFIPSLNPCALPHPSLHLPSRPNTETQRASPPSLLPQLLRCGGREKRYRRFCPAPTNTPDAFNRRQTSSQSPFTAVWLCCTHQRGTILKEHCVCPGNNAITEAPNILLTMVLCEDGECSVCLLPYSRMDRIPRVLHCRHTFCDLCLETMSQARSGMLTVGCPLCRRVTCIGRGLSLQEALWVNSRLWDQIPEEEEEEEEEEEGEEEEEKVDGGLKQEAEEERMETKQEEECVSSRSARTKLKLPAFFRRFSLTKQHQERIVPGSNVEMKSWRRLSSEETI